MAKDNTDSLTSEPIDLVPDRFIRTDRVRPNTGEPGARGPSASAATGAHLVNFYPR